MSEAKKFLFNNRDLSDKALEAQRVAQGVKAPMYSEADVENARDRAKREGVQEGMRLQKETAEQQTADLMQDVRRKVEVLMMNETLRQAYFEKDAVALALAMLHRVFPIMATRLNERQLLSDLETLFEQVRGQARILVAVHPEFTTSVSKYFAQEESVTVQSDASLGKGDARVAWPHGGAHIDREKLLGLVAARLSDALDGHRDEAGFGQAAPIAQKGVSLSGQDDDVADHAGDVAAEGGKDEPHNA